MQLQRVTQLLLTIWNRRWMLAVLSGIMLGLSFPPFNLAILQIPAFVLILRLADCCRSSREAAYWSYLGFVVWNLIVTYWLMMATLAGGIAAILANSVLMTIPVVLQRIVLRKKLSSTLTALTVPSLWVSYEYLHHLWDLAWPWLALGNGWANYPLLIQYISYTGYLGISFWVVLTATLLYLFIKRDFSSHIGWSTAAAFIALPLISIGIYTTLSQSPKRNQKQVDLVLTQPDFYSYQEYYGYDTPLKSLDEIIQLSDSLRSDTTDAVIWPENAIQPYLTNRRMADTYSSKIRSELVEITHRWQIPIITGSTYFEYYNPDTLSAEKLVRNPKSDNPYIYYNAGIGVYPDRRFKVYKKAHLVPMVERIPFLSVLHRYDPLGLSWHTYPWYGQGTQYTQFTVGGTRTPALVCYDSVFPHWMRGFITRGAGFLTIITNDGWWGNTSGHQQHFAFARLRAVEFRRWVARSANNGITGVIGPDGSVKKRTEYGVRTAIKATIPVRHDLTFFARHGAWLPWINIALSISTVIVLLMRSLLYSKS